MFGHRIYASQWRGLTVRARLWLGFGIVVTCTSIITLLAILQSGRLTTTMTELNTRELPEISTLEQLHSSLVQLRGQVRLIAMSTPQELPSEEAQLTSVTQTVTTQQVALQHFIPSEKGTAATNDTQLIADVTSTLSQINSLSQSVVTAIAHGNSVQAQSIESTQVEPAAHHALHVLQQLNTLDVSEAAQSGVQAQQDSQHATTLMVLLAGLVLSSSALFAWLLSRAISHPLAQLLRATETIAAGELEMRTPTLRHDEFGRLGQSFELMRQHLSATIATLAQERRQIQAIIEASADGILLVNSSGIIAQANPASARLCGVSTSGLLGQSYAEVLGLPDQVLLATTAEPPSDGVGWHVHQLGARWLAISIAAMPSDAVATAHGWIIGLHDITPFKAMERMQSDFVAMVSHELRAPLTTVTSSVELLASLDHTRDGEAYQEVVGILARQTQRLRQVIEEVLQLTRMDAGRLHVHLQEVPITTTCQQLIAQVQVEWLGEGRRLEVQGVAPPEPAIWADPALLEIVLRNILENARKYTPAGSPITLNVQAELATQRIIIRICDRGRGIPPEYREVIFERFTRAPTGAEHATRGFGLGLYIARELLHAMHGEIWIEGDHEGAIVAVALTATQIPISAPLTVEVAPC